MRETITDSGHSLKMMFLITFALANLAAWFTHVIVCIHNEAWLFLIAGALMFPIAVIHGVGVWFGAF